MHKNALFCTISHNENTPGSALDPLAMQAGLRARLRAPPFRTRYQPYPRTNRPAWTPAAGLTSLAERFGLQFRQPRFDGAQAALHAHDVEARAAIGDDALVQFQCAAI